MQRTKIQRIIDLSDSDRNRKLKQSLATQGDFTEVELCNWVAEYKGEKDTLDHRDVFHLVVNYG